MLATAKMKMNGLLRCRIFSFSTGFRNIALITTPSSIKYIKKAALWMARPVSRMLFAVVGSLRFDAATPIRAAPAT